MTITFISLALQIIAAFYAIKHFKRTPHTVSLFVAFAFMIIILRSIDIAQLPNFAVFVTSSVMLTSIILAPKIITLFNQKDKHLKTLVDIDHAILSSLSHTSTMNAIIDKISTTLDIDAAAVLTVARNNNHSNGNVFRNLSINLLEYIQSRGEDIVSSVIDNRKPYIISRIADDEDEPFLMLLKKEGFASYVASPIIRSGAPVGILTLYSRSPRHFTSREIEFISAVSDQVAIVLDRVQLNERIQGMGFESVRALVDAIEIRDPYTKGHSMQVANLSVRLAKAMGFSKRELRLIRFAGLLHDVGKIAIPETILQKQSALTADEWNIIKKHPAYSAKLVEPISYLRHIENWIQYHHERWDGRGYPERRTHDQIPLQSRILAVCDTYSAMTEDRPYRNALSDAEARREIEGVAGMQLDPKVVDAFLKLPADAFSADKHLTEVARA